MELSFACWGSARSASTVPPLSGHGPGVPVLLPATTLEETRGPPVFIPGQDTLQMSQSPPASVMRSGSDSLSQRYPVSTQPFRSMAPRIFVTVSRARPAARARSS